MDNFQLKTKIFSYVNKNNEIVDVEVNYGQNWDEIKSGDKIVDTIFKIVDDGDGKVQAEELNMLNKLVLYIDNIKNKNRNNGVLDIKELEKFAHRFEKNRLNISKIFENVDQTQNWSEGLERKISVIKISKTAKECYLPKVLEELKEIAVEQGFEIEEICSGQDVWIEDSSIRRHDGKIYVPYHTIDRDTAMKMYKNSYKSERGNVNAGGQGRVAHGGLGFYLKIDNKEKVYGTSYLEGGNVLNTIQADGKPAAIVGQSSIADTLEILKLENTPENVEKVKDYIAKDLGLDKENITFIPQFDFHIDMLYRPLENGCVAVPDIEEAIKILTELKAEIESSNTDSFTKNYSEAGSQTKDFSVRTLNLRIKKLRKLAESTKGIREEAEDYIKKSGYKIVKLPFFTVSNYDKTNFMNGIGGTSEKTGEKYFITNKSEYPALEKIIEKYLISAGVDKVYFISTTGALWNQGGIDCLTQEA